MVTCSQGGAGGCQAAVQPGCTCRCAGANHGIKGRLAWAAALAVPEPERTPSEQTTADRAIDRQERARDGLEERRAKRQKRAARGDTDAPIKIVEANETAEYTRTVDAVDWLVRHADERRQIEDVADAIAEQCTQLLEGVGPARRSIELRLSDHFWCDVLAALAKVLRTTQDAEDKLKDLTADGVATLTREVWRTARSSRSTAYGYRPKEKSRAPRPTRLSNDHDAELSDAVLEGAVRATARLVLNTLTAGPDTVVDLVLLKVRTVALMLCPDPCSHKLVWDECLVPVLKSELSSGLQQQITQLIRELREPLTWDVPDPPTKAR